MQRTTIMIPDELSERLKAMALERRVSMATIVRDALEEKIASYRPKPRSLGIGSSGHSDTARRAGDERPAPRDWR